MSIMSGSRRGRITFGILVRLRWLALVLVVGLFPTNANAITNYDLTMRKDGVVQGAPKSECMIVADFNSPIFTTSDTSTFRLIPGGTFKTVAERDGAATEVQSQPTVTADYAPPADNATRNLGGWFQLDYPNGVLDSQGNYHDLHIRFSQISITYRRNSTATGLSKVRQAVVQLQKSKIQAYAFHHMLFNPSNNQSLGWSYQDDAKARTVATNMKVSVWYDDSTAATPNLRYNLYGWDLDIYDRVNYDSGGTAAAWRTEYAEHMAFTMDDPSATTDTIFCEMDGSKGVVHVEPSTKLQVYSRRISGTAADDGTFASGFSTSLLMGTSLDNTGFKFWWGGSRCGTSLFQDFTYSLVARTGEGGHAWVCAGTGDELGEEKPDLESHPGVIVLDEVASTEEGYVAQRETRTIPRNDYTAIIIPEQGYRISHVDLDGVTIGEEGTAQGATDFAGAKVTFDEGGWAYVSVANASRNHVIRASFTRNPSGSLALRKQSANPTITEGNACYSLEEARYGIYSDEGCQDLVDEFSTDQQGSTPEIELPCGTYYVRETHAPKGYLPDETTHEIVVSEGELSVLEVSETPATVTEGIRIQKQDDDTDMPAAQGNSSLAGAQFSIDYYDVYASSLDDLPSSPLATWVFETNDQGLASFSEGQPPLQGQPFLVDGTPVIPLGTVVTREVKAPEGYRLPENAVIGMTRYELVEGHIEPNVIIGANSAELVVDDPVVRGGVKLKKTNPDGLGLPGASFDVTNVSSGPVTVDSKTYQPGETCLTITSGDDGIASCNPETLPYGTYELKEVSAPRGYRLDQSWKKTFDIAEDRQIVDLSTDPVINSPLTCSVGLTATKRFDGSSQGRRLERGMFSFTLYDESGSIIDTQTNDDDGIVSFDELSFGYSDLGKTYEYTIRESEGDDEEVVYDDHTETVRIRIEQDNHGELFCNVMTDDDGIVFENRTVDRITLPMTGMDGTHAALFMTVVAMLLGGMMGRRAFARGLGA